MSYLVTHLELVAVALVVLLAATLLMQDRRTPQSTVAWLLAMAAIPWVAVPLYLAFGARKSRSWVAPDYHGAGTPGIAGEAAATFRALGAAPASAGNRIRLIETGAEAHAALFALIDGAERSIDAVFYIVSGDAEGNAFVEALTRRAAEGVRVRLMIDRLGTPFPPRAALRRLRAAGGELRWITPFRGGSGRGKMNLRNHRKALVADDARAFAGGMNLGLDYMAPAGPVPFADLSFTVEGPAVRDYAAVFRFDWARAGREAPETLALPPPPEPAGEAVAQLVASGPDMAFDPLHFGLVSAIHRADRRVWIATPYFVPTEPLGTALGIAARRGLDVRILLPDRSNHRMADFARGGYLRALEKAGCRVLRHPRMLHAKAGLIDGMGWAGSANFDVRSMLLNFETALMLHDPGTVEALEAWYLGQAATAAEGTRPATLPRRLAEGVFRLGTPLL